MEQGAHVTADIEKTMRSAYLSYAMSVITSRALPDVRDGLKPVQRRILYAMGDMGLYHDRPTRKSARIVGEVLGKYHPHNDTAVYDAMVRMAQDFTMRYPLVDGQGNFGSVDGDGAAAVRYTEARLSIMGDEMLADLDKDSVDMVDNFDSTLKEPTVLPARLPNLLVNGVGGIAVGMATNIPPHNLGEIADAVAYLVDHYHQVDDVTLDDLMQFVQGPDFPTGGMILGDEGIRQAYATGRGRIVMRSRVHHEELGGGRQALIVTELPYQVNKSTLVGRIASLAREGRADGIADLRDESDRMGVRIVIELKRGVEWEPILATLLKYTQLQATFGVNMLALVEGEPRTLSLKRALLHYIDHRYSVVERRTRFDLERARRRAHILEGLLIALDHLDEVIDIIRRSRTADSAKTNLCKRFNFTEVQAQAILDLQLRRLAALERRRVQEEYREVVERIAFLQDLLSSEDKLRAVVRDEVLELKRTHGDVRRTSVRDLDVSTSVSAEDLVSNTDVALLLTTEGRVRLSPAGKDGGGLAQLLTAGGAPIAMARTSAQRKLVFVSNRGRAFGLAAHQIPPVGQQPDGVQLQDLVLLEDGERAIGMIALEEGAEATAMLATAQGRVKRVTHADLQSLGRDAAVVFGLDPSDQVVSVQSVPAGGDILLTTAGGRAIRFPAEDVRPQGLPATGMRGIDPRDGDIVVMGTVLAGDGELVVVTANGFGKRAPLTEYNPQGRGGQGSLTVDVSKSAIAGPLVAAIPAVSTARVAIGTSDGQVQTCSLGDLPRLRRDTWGRVVTRTRAGAVVQLAEGVQVVSCLMLPVEERPEPGNAGASRPAPGAVTPKAATRRRSARPSAAQPELPVTEAAEVVTRSARRRTAGTATSRGAESAPEVLDKPARTRRTARAQESATAGSEPADGATTVTRRRRARPAAEQPAAAATQAVPDEKTGSRRRASSRSTKPAAEAGKVDAALSQEAESPRTRRKAATAPAPPEPAAPRGTRRSRQTPEKQEPGSKTVSPSEPPAASPAPPADEGQSTGGTGRARPTRKAPQRRRTGG
ncbi:MAG: DNA gyrase subunit A [Anaerolineae bacterium]|jgi:DNA gyrase subunit A|nr:DNA gyrase subunit A [Chloroflexota bacterium]